MRNTYAVCICCMPFILCRRPADFNLGCIKLPCTRQCFVNRLCEGWQRERENLVPWQQIARDVAFHGCHQQWHKRNGHFHRFPLRWLNHTWMHYLDSVKRKGKLVNIQVVFGITNFGRRELSWNHVLWLGIFVALRWRTIYLNLSIFRNHCIIILE